MAKKKVKDVMKPVEVTKITKQKKKPVVKYKGKIYIHSELMAKDFKCECGEWLKAIDEKDIKTMLAEDVVRINTNTLLKHIVKEKCMSGGVLDSENSPVVADTLRYLASIDKVKIIQESGNDVQAEYILKPFEDNEYPN